MLTSLQTSPRPLGWARILIGIASVSIALEGAGTLWELQGDVVTAPVVSWMPAATDIPVLSWLFLAFFAALGLTIGFFPAACAAIVAGCSIFLLLVDEQTYTNHVFLQILLCLMLIASRSDLALAPGAAARRSKRPQAPWWPQFVMISAVSACYLFAGLSKVNPIFLKESTFLQMMRWIDVPTGLLPALAVAVIVTEIVVAAGLWFPRFMPIVALLGLGLHGSIVALLPQPVPLGAFGLLCLAVYPLALTRPRVPWREVVRPASA